MSIAGSRSKFGLLVYNGTDNLGDEIQSLAAKQFLPKVDYLLDRDALQLTPAQADEDIKVIMNGWFFKEHGSWPPPAQIKPLLTSFHLTPGVRSVILSDAGIAYLKRQPPIGARDLFTLDLLRKAGVRSFFSACLTLTLQRPPVSRNEDLIVLNDLRQEAIGYIRRRTDKNVMLTWHSGYAPTDHEVRSQRAEKLLRLYASAACVVTSRLHCALPCLAMGTPVLLIDVAPDQERFAGLNKFFLHIHESRFLKGEFAYDFDNPPPNPQFHLPYRQAHMEAARAFLRES